MPCFLRVGCVQLDPVPGNVPASMALADELLNGVRADELDLIVLPEMAFTEYIHDKNSIRAVLEKSGKGRLHDWARQKASLMNAVVVFGYAEEGDDGLLYNSVACVDPNGRVVCNYRKTQLYPPDDTAWAIPGPGFTSFALFIPRLDKTLKVVPAICMDLNPNMFQAPWEEYELANHTVRVSADVLLLCMAWHSHINTLEPEPEWRWADTAQYWITRLEPLFRTRTSVIICNRAGREERKDAPLASRYEGTSCAFRFSGDGYEAGEDKDERLLLEYADFSRERNSMLFRANVPV